MRLKTQVHHWVMTRRFALKREDYITEYPYVLHAVFRTDVGYFVRFRVRLNRGRTAPWVIEIRVEEKFFPLL